MDIVLSHASALRFYRTPPLVHALFEPYPDISLLLEKHAVLRSRGAFGSLDLPLHTLVSNKNQANQTKTCIAHVWSSEVRPGWIRDTEHGFGVTSPLFTLLCLARSISRIHMTLLLYEMAGSFTVYRPDAAVRTYLQNAIDQGIIPIIDGWKPMLDSGNMLTDLWQRPALIDIEEARHVVECIQKVPGAACLRRALRDVWGNARSPFEVQAAMLLGLSRRRGGHGLGPFELNKRIRLSESARAIARQRECWADLYLEGTEGHPPICIECQGAAYHNDSQRCVMDDNRALALQSMGMVVIRLRYEQISDSWRLQHTANYIESLLGMARPEKSKQLEVKERKLRANVLVDWWTLGI